MSQQQFFETVQKQEWSLFQDQCLQADRRNHEFELALAQVSRQKEDQLINSLGIKNDHH